jgi:hypothetical protein
MPNALGLLAEPQMRATPRNKLMGLLADALQGAQDYAQRPDPRMPGGKANPVLGLLADAASLQSLATTAQRVSYGEPLTNKGKANVPFLKPETADVAMMAPLSPRNALAALGMVGGFGDDAAMRAATVWHGSPHKFDKFDASKIGTGEGAQAYGHGLYLAEAPAVAKEYATKLSSAGLARNTLTQTGGDMDGAIAKAASSVDHYRALLANGGGGDPQRAQGMLNLAQKKLADLQAMKSGTLDEAGNLYKVDLPDDQIARMLDWDKPLRDQPNVMQALGMDAGPPLTVVKEPTGWAVQNSATGEIVSRNWADEGTARKFAGLGGANADANLTGQAFYRARHEAAIRAGKAKPAAEKEREAVEALRKAGIPGIRYLDGGSRGAGQGSSNFVVFPGNESFLSILERNGQPLR